MKTIILLIITLFSILQAPQLLYQNQQILQFFILQLFPSMFVFLIFLPMIELPSFHVLDRWLLKRFYFNGRALSLILLCILMGFPASFFLLNQQVKHHHLSIIQAQRLIYCVSIPSLSFMLMTLTNLFQLSLSLTLWIIQIISIFILLLTTKNIPLILTLPSKENQTLSKNISFAFQTMAFILAYLMITLVIKSFVLYLLPLLEIPILLFFEFSSACLYLSHTSFSPFLLTLCVLGFGGLCVHLQCMSSCEDCEISYWTYLKYRLLQMIIMFTLGFLLILVTQ